MKSLRTVYLIIAISVASFPVSSQGLYGAGNTRGAGWLTGKLPENARFSLEVGTSFSSISSGASIFGNYISPTLQYDLSPSFSIVAGGSFSFNQYGNLPRSMVVKEDATQNHAGLPDYSLFMSGRYMINENLIMTGTVYGEQGYLPMFMTNSGIMEYNNHGMSMGIEYRVSDNISFGAEVGVNRTNNPYYHNSSLYDPFGNRRGRSGHRLFP